MAEKQIETNKEGEAEAAKKNASEVPTTKIELKSLKGVEIFSIGMWNGDEYTAKDLDEIAFAHSETGEAYKPYLKIGHDEEQLLIKNSELPSAGYIENVRRVGGKLLADFVDIPKKVFFVLQSKAYRTRSAEIFWDNEFNGKIYKRMLRAVAFLGAEMPAVANLDDIINFYGLEGQKIIRYENKPSDSLRIYNLDQDPIMEDTVSKELEKKIADLETEKANEAKKYAKEQSVNAKKYEAEIEARKVAEKKIEEQGKAIEKMEAEQKDAEIKNFSKELVTSKLATPAMQPLIEAMFGPVQKDYSFTSKAKDEKEGEVVKKFSDKKEILKEILGLKLDASKVNLEDETKDVGESAGKSDSAIEAKIKKFQEDNKDCKYIDAYKAVMSEQNQG